MSTNTSNHLVNPAAVRQWISSRWKLLLKSASTPKNGYNGELTSRQARLRRRPDGQNNCPMRTMRFVRSDRTALAHTQEIKYEQA